MIECHLPNFENAVPYFPLVTQAIFSKTNQQTKIKNFYFAFTDLDKAFGLVIQNTARKPGMEIWLVKIVMTMYRNT